jgi:gluconokinase
MPAITKLIIGGVSGSGKTTTGKLLAHKLNWKFFDADDFHPPFNRMKMSQDIPLTDEDRQPWLQTLKSSIIQQEDNFVLACSALKRSYRNTLLSDDGNDMAIVMLIPSKQILRQRLEIRNDHAFMPLSLLDSQLETLDISAHANDSRASQGGRGEKDDDDDDDAESGVVWCIEVTEYDEPQHVVDSIHKLLFNVNL